MTEKKSDPNEVPQEVLDLHPLVLVVAAEFQPGEGDEQFAPLTEDKLIEVGAAILHYVNEDDPQVELLHVAQSFAAYALAIRDLHGSARLADQLLEVVSQDEVVNNLQKLTVSADPEKIQKIAARFGDFAGTRQELKAPKVGEAKPEGSIDINALKFPKRM
jgi:hypothetical protein